MTALEACNKIEEAINGLHEATRDSQWEISYTRLSADSEHLQDYKESLEKTRAHFKSPEMTEAWFVSTPENATLAWCGNSPTAEARAKYIAWVNPHNIKLLIDAFRELQEEMKIHSTQL